MPGTDIAHGAPRATCQCIRSVGRGRGSSWERCQLGVGCAHTRVLSNACHDTPWHCPSRGLHQDLCRGSLVNSVSDALVCLAPAMFQRSLSCSQLLSAHCHGTSCSSSSSSSSSRLLPPPPQPWPGLWERGKRRSVSYANCRLLTAECEESGVELGARVLRVDLRSALKCVGVDLGAVAGVDSLVAEEGVDLGEAEDVDLEAEGRGGH